MLAAKNSLPELEHDVYRQVHTAICSLPNDLKMLLTEMDILRGMVTGSFDSMFGLTKEVEHGRSPDVAGVRDEEGVGGGEASQPDNAETGGAVRSKRSNRKAAKRSRPRRNKRSDKVDTEPVES